MTNVECRMKFHIVIPDPVLIGNEEVSMVLKVCIVEAPLF